MEASRPQVRVPETRCPYCHDAIPRGVEPVGCPDCHAAHHEECLREHGRCATCEAEHPRFSARPRIAGRARKLRLGPWVHQLPKLLAAITMVVGFLTALPSKADWLLGLLIGIGASLGLVAMLILGKKQRGPGRLSFFLLFVGLGVALFPFLNAHAYRAHLWSSIVSGLILILLAGVSHGLERFLPRERQDKGGQKDEAPVK